MKKRIIAGAITLMTLIANVAGIAPAYALTTTVNFDTPPPPGVSNDLLNGVFQSIDFGIGAWRWEGPYGVDPTNNIFFDSSVGTSRTFAFSPSPKVLNSIRIFTSSAGTITLSDDAGQTFSQAITTGSMQTVTTNWTLGATTVTINITSGWNSGIDDIAFSDPAPANPPVLTITIPTATTTAPLGTVLNVSYTFAGDLAGSGITHTHFRLDGGPTLMDMSLDGSYQINNVPVGPHTLLGIFARADHSEVAGTATTTVFTSVIDPADTVSPAITITAPSNNATATGTIVLTASASDNVGIASVQFRSDGVPVGLDDTIAPYTADWNTVLVADGSHTLTARVRDLAGNETVSAPVSVMVANNVVSATDPSVIGQFATPFTMPIVAVNMVLMPNGKVLMWDGDTNGADARVWDPTTNIFTSAPNPTTNLFCSGQAILPDGSPVVIGGHNSYIVGVTDINRFNPVSQSWSQLAPMAYRRWYPTATILSDGRMLVVSGATTCGSCNASVPEVYNPVTNLWSQLNSAQLTMPLYPFMFQMPDGKVLYAGSDEANTTTRTLDVATQTWTTINSTVVDGGSAAMYRPGMVIKAGSPGNVDAAPVPAVRVAYVMDANQPSPVWRQVGSMALPRSFHTLTMLPDGNVIVTGGVQSTDETTSQGAFTAEIWNAQTETWSTMATGTAVRSYHSTGILLPDGRVLVAGSGRFAPLTNEFRGEIFSPPYLFKGARPIITAASSSAVYNTSSFVQTPDAAAITSVGLVRLGAVTHGYDQNQRYIPLSFTQASGGLVAQMPTDGNIAPPGHYMIFIVNGNGVPSPASIVQLSSGGDTIAPTAPATLSATIISPSQIDLSWSASTDNVGVTGYRVERCQGAACVNFTQIAAPAGTTYSDTGLAASTTYRYRVRATDAASNLSGYSPITDATTQIISDTIPPTVSLTAPAQGATVSGTITVSATASDNIGVSGVQFLLDGANLGAEDTISPYSISWDTTAALNGSHTLLARARDAAGNMATSTPVSVTVSNVPGSGPIAYWKFDETSGTTASDASGNGNTGTLFNIANPPTASSGWIAAGKIAGALNFDGANDYVSLGNMDVTGGRITIAAWFKADTFPGSGRIVDKSTSSAAANHYWMLSTDTSGSNQFLRARIRTNGTVTTLVAPTGALSTNTWYHGAVVYDGANIILYLNGVSVGSTPKTGNLDTNNTVPAQIGRNTGGSTTNQWDGLIDDVRIYNRALTQSEIQQLANVTPDTTAPSASLTAPIEGATVSGTITVAANASDDTGVAGVQFLLDGANLGAEDTTSPYSVSWNTVSAANGTHILAARARDAAGNVSTSTPVNVTVSNIIDTTPPAVSITAPLDGATATGTISITAAASDNIGVSGVQFLLDGANLGAEDTTAPYDISWNTALTVNGSHALSARARDAAGNQTTSVSVNVTVSNATSSPAGLVAAYGFNEGIGTVTADSSGNGQTGTLSGASWTASGRYGAGVSFNGTNNWVTVNDSNNLDLTTGMTLEAWVYPNAAVSGWRATMVKEATGGASYYLYAGSSPNSQPANGVVIGGTEYALKGGSTPAINTWTHLAATYDGAFQRLYVNGVQVASQARTGAMSATANPLRIGGNSIWGEYFNGRIDEVRIYNRALASTEIQTDMNVPVL